MEVGAESKARTKPTPKSSAVEESPTLEECTTNKACTEKDKNDEDRATLLSGKYLKILVTIPTGKSIQDRLTELK